MAVNYLHMQKVMHRDLKPQNILLTSKDKNCIEVKLADFGFSGAFDPKEGLDDCIGTPLFMAPEIIKFKRYNEKVDIWSIGIIAYFLLSGTFPFIGKDKDDILHKILNESINFDIPKM